MLSSLHLSEMNMPEFNYLSAEVKKEQNETLRDVRVMAKWEGKKIDKKTANQVIQKKYPTAFLSLKI